MSFVIIKMFMKLRDWIDKDKLDWATLSENPNAIELLKDNRDKINWCNLSNNHNAIELLKANLDKIDWEWIFFKLFNIYI
jgi:hypothetical protein